MGRPIKKIFIGERGVGGGTNDALASVTLGGTNNSTGYTAADALTIGAPDIGGSVQAVGEVTVYVDGALLEGVTTFTSPSGTEINEVATYPGVLPSATSGSGVGAAFTIAKAGGQVNYSDLTITVTSIGSGYVATDTITISGADLGGTSPANDLTFTVSTFVTAGTISGTVITEAGSGYTSAPTVSAGTGTQGTLTLTGVLSSGGTDVILSSAFLQGGSDLAADMIIQKGNNTYRVTTADGTGECSLVNDTPAQAGEMAIIATDSAGGTYYVTKLYNNTVRLDPTNGNGVQFGLGDKVSWAKDGVAVVDYSVVIT